MTDKGQQFVNTILRLLITVVMFVPRTEEAKKRK